MFQATRFVTLCAIAFLCGLSANAQQAIDQGQWPNFGGDYKNTKYSPLDQITKQNFRKLATAWKWEPQIQIEVTQADRRLRVGDFKPVPLMVDGRVYVVTALAQVAAIDAGTGNTLWTYDPESYKVGRPANLGFQHRGVSYWTDGTDGRIFIATHDRRLIALNAMTGATYRDFGTDGQVDLVPSLGRKVDISQITHSSPPGICRDTVIVGSIVSDGPRSRKAPPGHVRGFDARTGKLKWVFHTIPQPGEVGVETWEKGSWEYTGACNVWSMFAADDELGYVYLPTGTATNDMYGGHRLGNNLFAESIVCVNAETGERVWHFQAVHHGLWDYDFPTAPTLADVTVAGKPVKLLAQVSKQGFCYVLDRVSGKPIWPIEERPVTPSTVEGERASPTQPFPTRPAAYDYQGFVDENLIDFTPVLRAEALESLAGHPRGPLFTPPSVKGTLGIPSYGGASNWQGAALDPETGILYVPSKTTAAMFRVTVPDAARSDLAYVSGWFLPPPYRRRGLPITKPPYSRVTAIDLNTGDHIWMTPHGDGPRDHPLLKGLDLPPLGEPGGSGGPLVTKTLLFVLQVRSTQGPRLSVFDKQSGELLGHLPLPAAPTSNPVTYMHQGKQHIVVAMAGGRNRSPQLLAFALP